MIYDERKAKGKAPPPSTVLHEGTKHLESALSSSTRRISGSTSKLTSPAAAASEMASFNEHDDHSTQSSSTKSKIVVLMVEGALSSLGLGAHALDDSNAPRSKIVSVRVPPGKLANLLQHNSHLNKLSTRPIRDSNGADEAMAKPPHVRLRRSAISISETGSPLRREVHQSVRKLDQKQLTINSNQAVETASESQGLPDDTYDSPAEQFLLAREMSPPFRVRMSKSSFKQRMQPPGLNQQIGLSPPDWHTRQSQFLHQLGLSMDKRQQDISSQFDWQMWDTRTSWPMGPTPLKDLNHPLGSPYAPPPHNLLANHLSSEPTLMSNRRLLPAPMTAAFAAEGWNQRLETGVYSLPAPAATATDSDDFETSKEFKERLTCVFEQMMFVSGETAEASPETTGMIEEIVRAQVIEMVSPYLPRCVIALPLTRALVYFLSAVSMPLRWCYKLTRLQLKQASDLANRRGVRSISTADLIFLIRHDKAKVSRLKTFLSWKDVRKNVKDSDEKGGGDAGEVDFDDVCYHGLDDECVSELISKQGANLPGAGPVDSKKSSNKKAKLILPWEVQSFYSEQVPERDDEEDNEEEEEQNEATLARLASADERTKNMTRDEYVYWSDCRQASFTFRKGKRFREWAGFGVVTDSKPNDDIVDILGFLTFEIVQTLTEEALKVKAAEDLHNARTSSAAGGETKKRKREGSSLFEMPEEGRTPVEPKHVREAFRRLQIISKKYSFMRPGYTGIKVPLRLI